jgi:DNA (cytosine-5)-methyltransferase 1
MNRKKSYLTVTDQFCGAGGSSIGAKKAGAELRMALNHWKLAVETHNTNFPNADHDCVDISACDPRRYPSTDILITSPECTNHSLANGRKRKGMNQNDLFDKNKIDPSEERSRTTMFDVPRFAEFHQYEIIIVENVVDARYWVMWDAWIHAMQLLGYEHQTIYFNSMFAHPTPQSRDRMYVVFWRKNRKKPNLDFTPKAHCPRCGINIYAKQAWKKSSKTYGKYRTQYVYACPKCGIDVTPYYYCALNAIDWSIPITRICDRDRPLREKTLERIRMGLKKYAHEAMLISNFSPGWARKLSGPTGTITTQDHHALVVPPFIIETKYSQAVNDRSKNINAPLLTQSTQASQALVVAPFILNMQSNNHASGLGDPLTTVLTGDHKYLAMPPYIVKFRNNADAGRISESLNIVSAGGINHGLCVPPFLIKYYGTGGEAKLSDAMPTVTSRDRNGLVLTSFIYSYYTRLYGKKAAIAGINEALPVQPGSEKHALVCSEISEDELPRVEDCYFRMLQPNEILAAMAFPDDYIVLGNKRNKVKQLGNAVTPPVMEMILRRCIETFA